MLKEKGKDQGCAINRNLIVITIMAPNDLKINIIEKNNYFVIFRSEIHMRYSPAPACVESGDPDGDLSICEDGRG